MDLSASPNGAPADPNGFLPRLTRRCARYSARRPKTVLGLWLFMAAGFLSAGMVTGTQLASEEDFGAGESKEVRGLVAAAGLEDPLVENILVTSDNARTTSEAADAITAASGRLSEVGQVIGPEDSAELSVQGGRIALVQVTLTGDPDDARTLVEPVLTAIEEAGSANPDATLQVAGPGSFDRAIGEILSEDLRTAELFSLPVTLLILLVAFGALVAAAVPLFLGVTSVLAAIGGMGLISQLAPMDESAITLVILMGLAVGVDYSLFYVRREREERRAGRDVEAALNATASTVGRAIAISGMTVVIALCGLLLTGIGFFIAMGAATMLVVAFAVLGSLTALPALLSLLGPNVDRGRLPGTGRLERRRDRRRTTATEAGLPFGIWARLAAFVTRRPKIALVIALSVLGTIAVPALEMRTGSPGSASLPQSTPIIQAEQAIDEAFPGAPSTVDLAVEGANLETRNARAGLVAFGSAAREVTGGSWAPRGPGRRGGPDGARSGADSRRLRLLGRGPDRRASN